MKHIKPMQHSMKPFPLLSRNIMRLLVGLVGYGYLSSASAFEVGQRVWIDMPAVNINDDSYGEGEVLVDAHTGKVEVYVRSLTTSKAFSSGIFCASPSQSEQGWQSLAVYQLVANERKSFPTQQLLSWTEGYNRFYERQNWLHTFLKWMDHHPIIEQSQLIEHRDTARSRGQNDLALVNELMLMELQAYQTLHFQPFSVPQKVQKLVPVLQWIVDQLAQNPKLEQAWRPAKRDPLAVNQNSLIYFMTGAIDKVVSDAQKTRRLLLEKDLNADSQALDALLTQLTPSGTR